MRDVSCSSKLTIGYSLVLLLGEIVVHTGLRTWWPIELLNNFGAWFYLPIVGLIVGLLMGLRKRQTKFVKPLSPHQL